MLKSYVQILQLPLPGAHPGVGEAEVALRLPRKIGHDSGQRSWVKHETTKKNTNYTVEIDR